MARSQVARSLEPPIGLGPGDDHWCRGTRRTTYRRPKGRWERERETVGIRSDLQFLALKFVEAIRADVWDLGGNVDHASVQIKAVETHCGRSAVVELLIVREVELDRLARRVGLHKATRGPEVAVDAEEDLLVVLDEVVPDEVAVVAQGRRAAVGTDRIVDGHDGGNIAVAFDHGTRPCDARRGKPPVQRKKEELRPGPVEGVCGVVSANVQRYPLAIGEWHKTIEERGWTTPIISFRRREIVIPRKHGERDFLLNEDAERLLRSVNL